MLEVRPYTAAISMHWLDVTLPSIEENLALDEALLMQAEQGEGGPVLRLWEVTRASVVVGMNGKVAEEVWLDACRRDGVPIGRRCSGGGSVVLAPGCLVFSLVLPMSGTNPLEVRGSMQAILRCLAEQLRGYELDIQLASSSDLVWQQRKVSGNSQRRLRRYFLHHGTLLYGFDVELAERYLPMPSRVPEYRRGRSHRDFLTNLPLQRSQLVACLRQAFAASDAPWYRSDHMGPPLQDGLMTLAQRLVREKYSRWEWLTRR
ncbi:Lipoate--protein ligase 1 [bacterium HR36]|nr:Lipoate--protein ligase 1 [bacterium HR36]